MAVGTQHQTRLHIRVVARLPPEAEHVRRPRTPLAEAVVEVGGGDGPAAICPLGHVAALVEGVEGGAAAGGAARDEAIDPEHGLGGDAAAGAVSLKLPLQATKPRDA